MKYTTSFAKFNQKKEKKSKSMKTYMDGGFHYYYDFHLKMWTVSEVDLEGNITDKESWYYGTKGQMMKQHPEFKFTPKVEKEPTPLPSGTVTFLRIN